MRQIRISTRRTRLAKWRQEPLQADPRDPDIIGAAIARHLDRAGARVVIAARSRGDYGGPGDFVAADIATEDGPQQLAADATAHLGGIDTLVDNAASQSLVPDGALAMTDADWLADLNACLLSAVHLDRAVLPGMIAAGGGTIVHIGSNAARLPRPAALAYAAAKAALATYSKGLASQVGRHNVRVNLVSPGVIETSALAARVSAPSQTRRAPICTPRAGTSSPASTSRSDGPAPPMTSRHLSPSLSPPPPATSPAQAMSWTEDCCPPSDAGSRQHLDPSPNVSAGG